MEVRDSKRFADYFAVCGVGKTLESNDKNAVVKDPLLGRYKAEILDRYPATNFEDAPLPHHVWMFCFPTGVILRDSPTPPTFFIFALTELDGARFYGAALTYYEPLPERLHQMLNLKHHSKSNTERPVYYAPTCICILSHDPFYSIFREFLRYLYLYSRQSMVRIPIERIISNLIGDVPLPIPGVSRVRINLGEHVLHLSKPPKKHFSLADFSFNYLFQALGIYQTVQLFSCALHERKLIFISKEYTFLTIAAECITHLMYPFYWHHVYIPILPVALCDFLQAPTPFIMGLHPEYYREPYDMTDIVVVDLDKGTLKTSGAPALPEKEGNQLLGRLRQILTPDVENLDLAFPSAKTQKPSSKNIDLDLRIAFLGFFVSLFPAYREYMSFLRRHPQPIAIFHKARYLKARPDAVQFLSDFLETQAFAVFLEKHHQLSQNIFDEAAEAYVAMNNTTTKGSNDSMYEIFANVIKNSRGKIRETVEVESPDLTGLDVKTTYPNYGFTRLHQELYYAPRITDDINTTALARSMVSPLNVTIIGNPIEKREHVKTEEEISAEDFVEKWLDYVFSSNSSPNINQITANGSPNPKNLDSANIDLSQKPLLYDLFKLSHVRKVFADRLSKQKMTGMFVVSDKSFELLLDMVKSVLVLSNKTADFRTPATLMPLVATFYRLVNGLPEFLQNQLRDLDVWKNSHFWEAAFFESIENERKKLPAYVQDGQLSWTALSAAEKKEVMTAEENVIFSVLGSYAYHMLNLGVDADSASQFITRMSSLSLLTEEHNITLQALLKNINKVVALSLQPSSDADLLDGAEVLAPVDRQKRIFNNRQLDYFTSSMSVKTGEREEAKELYQKIIELKRKRDTPVNARRKNNFEEEPQQPATVKEEVPAIVIAAAPKEPEVSSDKRDGYTVKTLKGHCGGIDSMIIHENNKLLMCGTATGAVCVWSYGDGPTACVARVEKVHTDRVSCISTDGTTTDSTFVTGSHDRTVRVWSLKGGTGVTGVWENSHTLTDHGQTINCVEMHGSLVMSGAGDNNLRIFDTRTKEVVGTLIGHNGAVMCVQFDPWAGSMQAGVSSTSNKSGSGGIPYVVSGSRDTSIKIWDLRAQRCLHTLSGHHDWVRRVSFDSSRIVSCSFDCTLKIWDTTTGKFMRDLRGHTGSVNCFQYSAKSNLLASGSGDSTVKLWDMESGSCLKTLKGHTDEIVCLSFDDKKSRLSSGSLDQSVRVWDMNMGKCDKILRGHTDWVYTLSLHANKIFTGSWDNTVKIWEMDESLRRSSSTNILPSSPGLQQRPLVTALNLSTLVPSPNATSPRNTNNNSNNNNNNTSSSAASSTATTPHQISNNGNNSSNNNSNNAKTPNKK